MFCGIMSGWVIIPSANITRYYEGIREMVPNVSEQKDFKSSESRDYNPETNF